MSNEQAKRIRLIWGIVLSVLIVTVGVCFIVSCISIYKSGEAPFSRESVSAHFQKIAIPTYLCIGAVVVGGVMTWILPTQKNAAKAWIDPKITLKRLWKRLDTNACSERERDRLVRLSRGRVIIKAIASILCVAFAIPVAVYLFNPYNFDVKNINRDVFSALLFTVCFFADAVMVCYAAGVLCSLSRETEIALVKDLMVKGAVRKSPAEPTEGELMWEKWGRNLVKVLAITASVLAVSLFLGLLMLDNGFVTVEKLMVLIPISLIGVLLISLIYAVYFRFWVDREGIDCTKIAVNATRIVLLAIAVLFIVLGIFNGGMRDVLQKAIRICTECIGLG